MKSEIVTIGDELLIGQITNTNEAFIAGKLTEIGIAVDRMVSVHDELGSILEAFEESWNRADVVIATGGLGPTHDDVTKTAVCEFFNTELVSNDELRRHIEGLMKKRNIGWTAAAESQTLVPASATLIPNPIGTAAGMLFEETGKCFIVLPGVPYEMEAMMRESVVPLLASKVKHSFIRHLTLRTTGIPESLLAQQLGDLDELLQGASLAFLPSPTGVRLRITAKATKSDDAEVKIRDVERRIRAKVEKYIYGTGDEELEEVVGRILREKKLTIAVAESCTGGLIADRITDVSRSSDYFERGVVTYGNESKIQILGVARELIEKHGAVSKEVACAMAEGIRKVAGTSIGLSTTGIAGPTGGTAEKPVGLVWIGYADANGVIALKFNFGDNRRRTKERAAQTALELVRRKVLRIE